MSSLGVSARLKYPKQQKHELIKSHSQAQILANKLKQDGVMATVENVMQAVEQVAAFLSSSSNDNVISYKDSIINLCQHLKVYGAYIDILYQDQLNRAFVIFRNSSQDDTRLDYLSRLHLLELIELRANDWKGSDLMNQYYRKKAETNDSVTALTDSMMGISTSAATSASPSLLAPGEVIKPSGKFKQPTRIAGKNYCKDEVVIRNADSVMGIKGRRVHMIEELSETIISFQRVSPGAKERLVQITGANEESIVHAKQLIEDTIRRNASPVREHGGTAVSGPLTGSSSSINSSASEESGMPPSLRARALLHSLSTSDASIGEYKYTVIAGGHTLKISGHNLELVRTSKLVLDEYFSGEPLQDIGQFYSFDGLPASMAAADLPPLSTPDSLPSPLLMANGGGGGGGTNSTTSAHQQHSPLSGSDAGDTVDAPATPGAPQLRRPNMSIEEIMRGATSPESNGKYQYTIEFLARLAMSPLCLVPPIDWERINTDYPSLARKVVEMFDAKQYLNERSDADNVPSVIGIDDARMLQDD